MDDCYKQLAEWIACERADCPNRRQPPAEGMTFKRMELIDIAGQIESQFPTNTPDDDYQFEFKFRVLLDFRDWRIVLAALRGLQGPSALTNKQLNDAIGFLDLTDCIKPVTPYGSAGEMLRHIIAVATDRLSAQGAR